MTLYEELKARGLVAQITDEEIIDLINKDRKSTRLNSSHAT